MDTEKLQATLQGAFPDCDISVEGGDGKFLIQAVGEVFEGLNTVKRNQAVYSVLNEHISSGAIHAVTMRLHTPSEFNAS